jgi:hypothetical protein
MSVPDPGRSTRNDREEVRNHRSEPRSAFKTCNNKALVSKDSHALLSINSGAQSSNQDRKLLNELTALPPAESASHAVLSINSGAQSSNQDRKLLNELTALPTAELEELLNQTASKLGPDSRMRIAESMCPRISIFTESREPVCLICGKSFRTEDLRVMVCCYRYEGIQIWCTSCVRTQGHLHPHKILAENFFFKLVEHVCGDSMRESSSTAEDSVGRNIVQEEPPIRAEGVVAVALLQPEVADVGIRPDGAHEHDDGLHFGAEEGVVSRLPAVVIVEDHKDSLLPLANDGNKYIGSRCLKFFDQKPYIGTVVAWDADDNADGALSSLWRVVYHDAVMPEIPITKTCQVSVTCPPLTLLRTLLCSNPPYPFTLSSIFLFLQDEEDFDESELLPLIHAFQKASPTRQFRKHLAAAEDSAAEWDPADYNDNKMCKGKRSARDDTARAGPRRKHPLI